MNFPKKFSAGGDGGTLGSIAKKATELSDKLNPFASDQKSIGKIPFYSTGARAFIRIGGKPVGVCTDIRWQVAYQATPIQTIDTPFAWDVDVGQNTVTMTMTNIMDPTGGPEASGMFATMQSAVHQPFVEIQVLDALGTALFFSRGMFTSVSGSVSRGNLSTFNANFVGVAYQHYVAQSFKPYDGISSKVGKFIGNLKKLASGATGGIL